MTTAQTIVAGLGAPDYPVLDAFIADRSQFASIMGPLGSGKTYAVCQRLMLHMIEQEPNAEGERRTRWLAVRNTFPELMGTTADDFCAVFKGLGEMHHGGGLKPPHFRIGFRLEDGTTVRAEVIFLALDREDAVRKIRGYQLTGVWANETKELVKPVIDMLQGRCGRYPSEINGGSVPTWYGMLGDTNAPDQDHWYYHLAEEERPEGWAFFRQPGAVRRVDDRWVPCPEAENLGNLVEGYYPNQIPGKKDDWINVMLANEYGFVSTGKPVHAQYIDSVHTSKEFIEPVPGIKLTLGIDYGREPACVIWQFLPIGRWVAIDEFVSSGMSASIFGPELKLYLQRNYREYRVEAWGDPAGDAQSQATEDTPTAIMRKSGIPVRAAPSNSVTLRRAALANPCMRLCMDGKPALLVSPKCIKLRKGLSGGWVFRRLSVAGDERYRDMPDKGPLSHVCEAAEYGLLGGGEGQAAVRGAVDLSEPVQTSYL